MMSNFGLTPAGLVIPSFEDWVQLYYDEARRVFDTDVNVGSSSVLGQLLGIFAFQDIQTWEALQGVYSSQTLLGAEGIYLDEILSRRGIFRKGAAAGTGFAYIEADREAAWTTSIPTSTSFFARNGKTYTVSTETQLRDRVGAYKVSTTDVTPLMTSVTYSIINTSTGALVSQTFDATLPNFLTSLAAFIVSNILPQDSTRVFIDGNTLYVGFLSGLTDQPVGLRAPTRFFSDTLLGTKWSLVPVTCTETGVFPVLVGDITSITPTPPLGFRSVGNFTEFFAGREVETDAEYRARFNNTVDEANAATRPAIYKAVSDLDGVSKVRIYDNNTAIDTPEAPAFTFNTIVLGGEVVDIANTLYQKKPINTLTHGTTSYVVITEDNSTEIIKFTPATELGIIIKVVYKTVNDLPLTDLEKSRITQNFVALSASFGIGTNVFNAQLQSVVFSSLTYGKLISLQVLTRIDGSPDGFSPNNIEIPFDSVPFFVEDAIVFEQTV